MFTFNCKYCGKEFQNADRNRMYCSHLCSSKDKTMDETKSVNYVFTCQFCGKVQKNKKRVTNPKYCSLQCHYADKRAKQVNPDGTKYCIHCKQDRPLNNFYKNESTGVISTKCRDCSAKQRKEHRKKHPDWEKVNRDNHVARNPEIHRKANLKSKYGLSIADYEEMMRVQGGVCKLCGKPETAICKRNGKVYALAVDHDHKTGKVRGLLCTKCNRGIGFFNEDYGLVLKIVDYLKSYQQIISNPNSQALTSEIEKEEIKMYPICRPSHRINLISGIYPETQHQKSREVN